MWISAIAVSECHRIEISTVKYAPDFQRYLQSNKRVNSSHIAVLTQAGMQILTAADTGVDDEADTDPGTEIDVEQQTQ